MQCDFALLVLGCIWYKPRSLWNIISTILLSTLWVIMNIIQTIQASHIRRNNLWTWHIRMLCLKSYLNPYSIWSTEFMNCFDAIYVETSLWTNTSEAQYLEVVHMKLTGFESVLRNDGSPINNLPNNSSYTFTIYYIVS